MSNSMLVLNTHRDTETVLRPHLHPHHLIYVMYTDGFSFLMKCAPHFSRLLHASFFFLQWVCEDDLHAALQRNTTQYDSKFNIEAKKQKTTTKEEEPKTRRVQLKCPSAHSETRRVGSVRRSD